MQALEQDRYSLRMQLAQQTRFKEDAVDEIENVRSHLTAEHRLNVDKLSANHDAKVNQLTKQVCSVYYQIFHYAREFLRYQVQVAC